MANEVPPSKLIHVDRRLFDALEEVERLRRQIDSLGDINERLGGENSELRGSLAAEEAFSDYLQITIHTLQQRIQELTGEGIGSIDNPPRHRGLHVLKSPQLEE